MPTAQKMTGFRANVSTATLKVKKWNGKDHLVGPVIMAREIVMNGLLYPSSELKTSIPHWNGRPVVNGHPKDGDNYISANDPAVLEKSGLGFVFNASIDKASRQKAELWLDIEKIATHKEIKKKIDDGDMLEVSTGLWTTHEEQAGNFNGRDYNAIARNHKPDHLAILPNEIGACSVADGAGFPRANELLDSNELSIDEKYRTIGKAVRKKYTSGDSWAFVVDVYDKELIFEKYVPNEGWSFYKVEYTIAKDEQTVTFTNDPKKVIQRKTYVDSVEPNVLQQSSTEGNDVQPKTGNGETTMNKQEKINKLLADKLIDANEAKTLGTFSDEQFALFEKNVGPAHKSAETLSTDEKEEEGEEEEEEDSEVDGNADKKDKAPKGSVVVDTNKDADFLVWAKQKHDAEKAANIKAIMANKSNEFTKTELETMHINTLERMARLAGNTTDMAGAPSKKDAVKPDANSGKKVSPYIPAHLRKKDSK